MSNPVSCNKDICLTYAPFIVAIVFISIFVLEILYINKLKNDLLQSNPNIVINQSTIDNDYRNYFILFTIIDLVLVFILTYSNHATIAWLCFLPLCVLLSILIGVLVLEIKILQAF